MYRTMQARESLRRSAGMDKPTMALVIVYMAIVWPQVVATVSGSKSFRRGSGMHLDLF
jgi:hypothetical protein